MTAVMPASVHSATASQKGSEANKMASSGNAELFKTGEVMGIANGDKKGSTGNQEMFRSGFAKSDKE